MEFKLRTKEEIRRATIENPNWIRNYLKKSYIALGLGLVIGAQYTGHCVTEYWNPLKQFRTINQLCKYGTLSIESNFPHSYVTFTPSIPYTEMENRITYDSPDGELYYNRETGKFGFNHSPRVSKSIADEVTQLSEGKKD